MESTSSGVSGKSCVGDFDGSEPKFMVVHVKGAKLKVLTQRLVKTKQIQQQLILVIPVLELQSETILK